MTKQTRRLDQLRRFDRQFRRQGRHRLAGVDEAGRGPLAGPVVAGAVVLRRSAFTVPVDDSKRLSPRARRRAFLAILACADIGIGIVEPAVIDTLNIFHASLEAMRQAVAQLPDPPDHLLIDGPWRLRGLDLPMTPVVHGDRRSLAIACASIVAKVVRDELMTWYDQEHPAYGFARHKGYPTAAHLAALLAHGPSSIHRRSFRPVARLLGSDPARGLTPSAVPEQALAPATRKVL